MEPVRTCVGCRSHGSRSSLLRVTVIDNALVFDERKIMPGRGAWVHDEADCLAKAIQRKAFARALRVTGLPDTRTIEKRLNGYGNKVNGSK